MEDQLAEDKSAGSGRLLLFLLHQTREGNIYTNKNMKKNNKSYKIAKTRKLQQNSLQPTKIGLNTSLSTKITLKNSNITPKRKMGEMLRHSALTYHYGTQTDQSETMPRGQNPTINSATNAYLNGFIPVDARNVFTRFSHVLQ